MSKNIFEKNLGGMMNSEIVDKFTNQVNERGHKIKRALASSVKLWVELPEEIQVKLLNQSTDSNSFMDIVRKVVDDYLTGMIQFYPKSAPKIQKPITIRDALESFVQTEKAKRLAPGYKITPSDEELWDELRKIAGDVREGQKKTKEG
jgi:ATP-dependent Clp protease adapter protein ClpS